MTRYGSLCDEVSLFSLSSWHLHGLPLPGEGGGVCQTRLTIAVSGALVFVVKGNHRITPPTQGGAYGSVRFVMTKTPARSFSSRYFILMVPVGLAGLWSPKSQQRNSLYPAPDIGGPLFMFFFIFLNTRLLWGGLQMICLLAIQFG